jgi:hypothetical protein
VVDTDDDADPGDDEYAPMRVINENVGTAAQIVVEGTPLSDYPGNASYPDDAVVVETAYEDQLSGKVTDWRASVGSIHEKLREFREEWGVDVDTYFFVVQRLEAINDPVQIE